MTTFLPTRTALLVLGLGALAACRATPEVAAPAEGLPAELALAEESATIWEYMSKRYDADGDGAITLAEYDRESGRFQALDRDGDGRLVEQDFEPEDREAMMREYRARMSILGYFQLDEDYERLGFDEFCEALAGYDGDADGLISKREFDAGSPAHAARLAASETAQMMSMMGDLDPWTALVEVVDASGDGSLDEQEFVSFFEAHDGGEVWTVSGRPARARPITGPTVGTLAPEFSLKPPDGGEAVTLSAFRGEKPVALIFGSYT